MANLIKIPTVEEISARIAAIRDELKILKKLYKLACAAKKVEEASEARSRIYNSFASAGGFASAASMTEEQRSARAKKAADARWGNKVDQEAVSSTG